jgi:hypothetical protein
MLYWTRDEGEKTFHHAELFFATNYWLRNFKRNKAMNSGREAAIRDLFACNARILAQRFQCASVQSLPNELEHHFGRRMELESVRRDVLAGAAKYMSRAEIEKYRLSFNRDGRAFQLQWWANRKKSRRIQRRFTNISESTHAAICVVAGLLS